MQFLPATVPARDRNGRIVVSATWEFNTTGTITPQATSAGVSVTSDGEGNFPEVTLTDGLSYRAILKTSTGTVLSDITSVIPNHFAPATQPAMAGGFIVPGARWEFYTTETTTPRAVFSDPDLTAPLGDKVYSDASGVFPEIYLTESNTYGAKLVAPSGNVLATIDPVTAGSMLLYLNPDAQLPLTNLQPGDDWDGAAGSGFTEESPAPVDPTRTTAKPGLRLLTPPNQHFTDMLDVGVIAAANDDGTLGDTWGIESVKFYYEGNVQTVTAPRWNVITTERGQRAYFGWWTRLQKPEDQSGKALLYVEAEANDATMQKRVLGPFNFSPVETEYDLELEIAPSQPEIVGQRYQSFWPAISYARTQFPHNPRFLITEAGKYEIERNPANNAEAPTDQYSITGRYTIEASVPGVSIGRLEYTTDALALIPGHRTWWRIRGSNITYDTRYVRNLSAVTNLPANPEWLVDHWLDGNDITTSDPDGKNELFRGGTTPRGSQIVAGLPWITECNFYHQNTPTTKCSLVRGCYIEDSSQDLASNNRCMMLNTYNHSDQGFWNSDQLCFTVEYDGEEEVATLSRSGGNYSSGTLGGIWTLLLGETSYTFDTGNGGEDYYQYDPDGGYNGADGVGGYWVSDVTDWLNTFPGITATLSTELAAKDRVASACSLSGIKGQGFGTGARTSSIAAADLIAGPVEIVWCVDTHGDFYQHTGGVLENVIVAFNTVYDAQTQLIFLAPILNAGVAGSYDIFFIGNSVSIDPVEKLYYSPTGNASQYSRNQPMGHVVIAHNTLANQGFRINTVTGNVTDAGYNLFKNNAMRSFAWTASPLPGMVIDGLHLHAGSAVPQGATNFIVDGNQDTLYADYNAGDYTPTALMKSLGFVPAIPTDKTAAAYPNPCAPGSVAAAADQLLVIEPTPDPADDLSALGVALATLLGSDIGSGMFDLRTATNNGLFVAQNLGGGCGDLVQGTASLQPALSETTGSGFDDDSTRMDAITGEGSAPFDVYLVMRKDAGSVFGHIINATITYQDGSGVGTGATVIAVDAVTATTKDDLHTALDDAAFHTVSIENVTPAGTTQTSIMPFGRSAGSLVGDIALAVVVRRAGFPSNIAAVKTAALAWLNEQKDLLP